MTEHLDRLLAERTASINALTDDAELRALGTKFIVDTAAHKYSYNFDWLGRPIIQFPQDIVATQELIWRVKPDLIIETGIAHGGSLILSASVLALIEYAEAVDQRTLLDPTKPKRKVLGIDIDVRPHNRAAIEAHALRDRIEMLQGSSVDTDIIESVKQRAQKAERVMVFLDSNHTHDHVLAELEAYAPLTSIDSYCVVFDTVIEDMPHDAFPGRPWGKGDNPKTAVRHFLKNNPSFEVERAIEGKLLITVAPEGYLRRVR